jgi:hypothetical protein
MSRPEHNIKHNKKVPEGYCNNCGKTTKKRIHVFRSPLNKQLEGSDHFVCRTCINKYGTDTDIGDFMIKRMGLKEFAKSV